nr:MAG TPA: hypothetical protein [Caudoviricetes sp.]
MAVPKHRMAIVLCRQLHGGLPNKGGSATDEVADKTVLVV